DVLFLPGQADGPIHRHKGPLPPMGKWVRLEVLPDEIGLQVGVQITGIAFVQFGGTAYYDKAGVQTRAAPGPAKPPSRTLMLHVAAVIDGKDELQITQTQVRWIHHEWSHPAEVKVGGVDWNTQKTPVLNGVGISQLVGSPITDLSRVSVRKLRGRGSVDL